MNQRSFYFILNQIENNPIFHNNSTNVQTDVRIQLAVVLERVGCDGNGVSVGRTASRMGIAAGTVQLFTFRVMKSIMELKDRFVKWPSEEERRVCSQYMDDKYCLKGAIGIIDGSHFHFSQRPAVDGETYWTRKSHYSINTQVIYLKFYLF